MPEKSKKRNAAGEVIPLSIGGGVAAASMLPWMLAPKPVERNIKRLSPKRLISLARPGDVILTTDKAPVSGWRALGRTISDSPYYHAEIIGPRKHSYMTGNVDKLRNLMEEEESVQLLRPKLTRRQRIRLTAQLKKMVGEDYSAPKVGLTFLYRSLLPGRVRVPQCKGNVCSTGPAAALRGVGYDPKLPSTLGYELAGDYPRSTAFKTIGTAGTQYDPVNWHRYHALPRRLGLALALGGGTYVAGRDIAHEPLAPVSAAVGGGLGLVGGKLLEEMALEADPAEFVRKFPGGRFIANGPRRERILELASKGINKVPLMLPPTLALAGAGIPYLIAKLLYRRRRLRREAEERERLRQRRKAASA